MSGMKWKLKRWNFKIMKKTKDQKTINALHLQIKILQEEIKDERRLLDRFKNRIDQNSAEITTLRENISNYQEAINILGRSSRMRRTSIDIDGNFAMKMIDTCDHEVTE